MKDYYIILQDRRHRHSPEQSDYHLELVSRNAVGYIIDEELSFTPKNYLIITSDHDLLSKYIFALSEDDFKLLCDKSEVNHDNVRLDRNYFRKNSLRSQLRFDKARLFGYFEKIKNGEIISASNGWQYETWDDGRGNTQDFDNSLGWLENYEFHHLPIPDHYKSRKAQHNYLVSKTNLLRINYYPYVDLADINKLLNVDLLSLNDNPLEERHWDYIRDGKFKYFDKVSYCRLYISDNALSQYRNDNSVNLKLKTLFTTDYYIEYHIE